MAILRVEGRNIGDEGFGGSNVRNMETGRMDKEAAAFLTETIKKAIAPIEYSVKTNKVAIALTAKNMATAIKDNTQEFQEIIQENGQDTQDQLLKLLTMMSDAQKKTGDASVLAIKDVIKQIEKIKASDPSGKLTETLGLDKQQKDLSKQIGRQTVFGAAFKKFTNVDLRTEKAMSALSPTKLFGLDPGAGDVIADQKTQLAAANAASGAQELGEALVQTKKEEIAEKATPKTTPTVTVATVPVDQNAEGGSVFTTSIDRESLANKQVELLEDILKQLKEMESLGNGKSILDDILGPLTKFAKFAAPLAAFALPAKDLYDILSDTNGGANNENTGGVVGAALGGIIGSLAGPWGTRAGIAIGNIVGSTVGSHLDKVEQERRNKFNDRTKDDPDYMNLSESDRNLMFEIEEMGNPAALTALTAKNQAEQLRNKRAAKESGLYDERGVFSNSRINQNILATTTDIGQLEAIIQDDDLSDSDLERVQARLDTVKPYIAMIEKNEGRGVLSLEAQGMTPQVTRTGDAVSNMSEAYNQVVNNVTNIFNNTTNNTSGNQSAPISVMPPSVRNNDSAFRFFQHNQNTGR
tara:strand:+ start:342 stop:2087 length:1746 start_codon:yes stop_codon:yes gene_type:complete